MESLPIVLVPGLGRPSTDYASIVPALEANGQMVVSLEPAWPREGDDLYDLAESSLAAVTAMGIDSFHLVGHAFGNRVARALVHRNPIRVRTLTLLAAGGQVPMSPEVRSELLRCYDPSISAQDLEAAVRACMLSPQSTDIGPYANGWNRELALRQGAALERSDNDWLHAAAQRTLLIQGLDDVIAVPENAHEFIALNPEVKLVEIEHAGHALVCEQPAVIVSAILNHVT